MATVSGFESLSFPGKPELRQFAELFAPLFQASSEEAKRQAVAALSQNSDVPPAVAHFIASQPISIAASFLASSPCLPDDLLILIARTQGAAHARAIVRRENLSPRVIDALVGLHHEKRSSKTEGPEDVPAAAAPSPAQMTAEPRQALSARETPSVDPHAVVRKTRIAPSAEAQRVSREDELRETIRKLAQHLHRPESDRLGLYNLSPVQEALLVRFARAREGSNFATTLANALSASRWLAERILLDISGRQLAVTLTGLGMKFEEAVYVLTRLYPQLARSEGEATRAWNLMASLDPVECEERIEAWQKADRYTFPAQSGEQETSHPVAANAAGNPAAGRGSAVYARQRLLALKGRR